MGYYEFPHTRNYDTDLGYLIKRYFELNNDFESLEKNFNDLKSWCISQLNSEALKTLVANKLDEWLQDGTLAALINNPLNHVTAYDTIVEMLTHSALLEGSKIYCSGADTINDGKGGHFRIRARLSTDVIDSYNLYLIDGSLKVAERLMNNEYLYITPEQFGAKGDGVTDDSEAINSCIEYANTNKISVVKFSPKTYLIKSTITCPATIRTQINIEGNGATINYTGNNWAFKFLTNFDAETAKDMWLTKYYVKDLHIFGTSNGIGGIKTLNVVWYKFENIIIEDFTNGCGFQLYVKTGPDSVFWSEEIEYLRCIVRNTKYGYQTFNDATGVYDGCDPSQSDNGVSVNHTIYEYCTFNGQVDNAVGFDIHGNLARCIWLSCGGWLNENGSSGNLMFNIDGPAYGAELIQPWIDAGANKDNSLKISRKYPARYVNERITVIGITPSIFVINPDDLLYINIIGDSIWSGNNKNQTGDNSTFLDSGIDYTDLPNGFCLITGNVYNEAGKGGSTRQIAFDGLELGHLICGNVEVYGADSYNLSTNKPHGEIQSLVRNDSGKYTGMNLCFASNNGGSYIFHYFALFTKY